MRVEVFQYPADRDEPAFHMDELEALGLGGSERQPGAEPAQAAHKTPSEEVRVQEWELRLAEERRRSFEAGREQGRQQGHAEEMEARAALLAAEGTRHREQAAGWVARLMEERERTLGDVEQEVVKLALAVAARILRREAQMDPLLLSGAVRVALGQLSASSEVRLKVPPGDLNLWTEAIALLPRLAIKPAVLPGEGMRLGDIVIETQMGSVDLGVRAQLGEIERGFFDRAGGVRESSGGNGVDREALS